jgi:hypothetical protein
LRAEAYPAEVASACPILRGAAADGDGAALILHAYPLLLLLVVVAVVVDKDVS